jgi:hypothetical protein
MYTIVDWEELYEYVRSGRGQLQKLQWIAVVNKLDGPNYRWLVAQKNGLAAFGCFIALLEVCGSGKPERNGDLKDGKGRPLGLDDLDRLTGIKMPQIVTSLEFLTSDRLQWIAHGNHVDATWSPDGRQEDAVGNPDGTTTLQDTTLQDKTKEDRDRRSSLFDELWKDYPRKDGKIAARGHFNVSVETEQDETDIRTALTNYKAEVAGVELQYIKKGATWFYNWQDFIVVDPDPIAEKETRESEQSAKEKAERRVISEQQEADRIKADGKESKKSMDAMRQRIKDGTATLFEIQLIEMSDRDIAMRNADGSPTEGAEG